MGLATSASVFLRAQLMTEAGDIQSPAQVDAQLKRAADKALSGALNEADYDALVTTLTFIRRHLPARPTVADRIPDMAMQWKMERPSLYKERKRPRMPTHKKAEYTARRRELAGSGLIPRELHRSFTTGALAALSIVAQEVAKTGACSLVIEKIAALAGVCHATVRRALQKADELGFLAIVYRARSRGRTNLPNVVTIKHKGWREWVKRRFKKPFDFMAALAEKSAKLPGLLFSTRTEQECYPTPATLRITGNRLNADYVISVKADGIGMTPRAKTNPPDTNGAGLRKG